MEEIAAVYARSLFEVAQEQNKLDTIREQLGVFADALSDNRELQVFFFSPYFSTTEKEDGLDRHGREDQARGRRAVARVPRASVGRPWTGR